jgi:hypothetical protein
MYKKVEKPEFQRYSETSYLIDWSFENVTWLITNSGKKGRGNASCKKSKVQF